MTSTTRSAAVAAVLLLAGCGGAPQAPAAASATVATPPAPAAVVTGGAQTASLPPPVVSTGEVLAMTDGSQGPMIAAGQWRMTITGSSNAQAAATPPREFCNQRPESLREFETGGQTCTGWTQRREGATVVADFACHSPQGAEMVAQARYEGDFTQRYTLNNTSRITNPGAPEPVTFTMSAEMVRVGDCPTN